MSALEDQLDRDPHDDTAFLVYADALLERGNPHGELIRVQHALRRHPEDEALQARDLELRQRVMPDVAPLSPGLSWSLGFPRGVNLYWVDDDSFAALSTLLRSRLFRFIETVTLSDYVTAERVIDLLVSLPHLREVSMSNNLEMISSRNALRLLAAIGRLGELRRLELRSRSVTALLTEMPAFSKLERLSLYGARLRHEDAPALASARQRFSERCVLRLEQSTLSFTVEPAALAAWPYQTEDLHRPGLLVEGPRDDRGAWLLASGTHRSIGLHPSCDLTLGARGVRAVHSVFDGNSIRDAGDLTSPPRQLRPDERVAFGEAVVCFCDDVAVARAALRQTTSDD